MSGGAGSGAFTVSNVNSFFLKANREQSSGRPEGFGAVWRRPTEETA